MAYLPRGIAPELLVSQVKNTMPYLFESPASVLNGFVPEVVLKSYKDAIPDPLSHLEYFRLCLSSHYLTCATPVPTDVDNQIRHKLAQVETDRFGEWRIYAGFNGLDFCGEFRRICRFVSIIFS